MNYFSFRSLACQLAFIVLIWTGCKPAEEVQWDGELQSSLDNGLAESEFSAIRNLVDTEGRNDSTVYGNKTGGVTTGSQYCPGADVTVTVTGQSQASLVIDFGSGTNCLDGRQRSGKLLAEFNGLWKDAGSYVVVTPENYTVSGYAMDFTKTLTYNGRNGSGNMNWTVEVRDAVIYTTTGNIEYESDRSTEWVAGEGDLNPSTNEYLITGNATGIARNGVKFIAEIEEALQVKLNCPNVVGGILSLTPEGRLARTLDYGEGACDKTATLTVGSYTTQITLP